MSKVDDQLNEYHGNDPFPEGSPNAVAQGYDVIEELNGKPWSDHEVGPGTKDFAGD